jgi:lipoate-protein ligase A
MNAEIQDGKQQLAHLRAYIKVSSEKFIEECEEHQALREKHHRALSKAEEIHLEWAELSQKQLNTIEELKKELAELKEKIKFLEED